MWFRNLYLFQIETPADFNAEQLQEALEQMQLTDCPASARENSGWTSPFGKNNPQLVLSSLGFHLIRMARQQRLLPASVIKDHLLERVDNIQTRDDRKVGAKERRDMKEELEFELLPKAFIKNSDLDAWIDTRNNWLLINTSSPPRAESFVKLLNHSLSGLSIRLPQIEASVMAAMTQWLVQNNPPKPFEFGADCLFKSPDQEVSTVAFKKHPMNGEEVASHLAAGKFVSQLELIWAEKISFILTDDFLIKRVRFLDIMSDDFDKQGFESAEEKIDAEFAIMVGDTTQMLGDLLNLFTESSS